MALPPIPNYAMPFIGNDEALRQLNLRFNPEWLRWFLQLAQDVNAPFTNQDAVSAVATTFYPIGSLYITTLATDPATLLGFGTWTAFGAGRVPVFQNGADTDFDVAEETGGAKTVSLPAHTHDGASSLGTPDLFAEDTSAAGVSVRTGNPTAASISTLQPYIVVYAWKRTA